MTKNNKILLGVAVAAVAAYLVYRWWANRQADQGLSPTGSLGTNLNSVAPELVGGSSGPSVGPAVSLPVNVTLTEQIAPDTSDQDDERGTTPMVAASFGANPVHASRNAGVMPAPLIAAGGTNSAAANDAATGMHQQPDDAGATFDTEEVMDSDDDDAPGE